MDRKRLCLILFEILNGADIGNHDKKKDYKGLFDEIYDGPLLIAEKILLSHEPVYGLPWCLNIHGHGKLIKGGILSDISSIHRITIDQATEEKKNGEAVPDN